MRLPFVEIGDHFFFHPRWWKTMSVPILRNELKKAEFVSCHFGHVTEYAKVLLDLTHNKCAKKFIVLLKCLEKNNNLRCLSITPPHCQKMKRCKWKRDEGTVRRLLENIIPKLEELTLGNLEDIPMSMEEICHKLNPSLKCLMLATQRSNFARNHEVSFDPKVLSRFTKLQVLSLDLHHISDELLDLLDSASELRQIVIYIHSINDNYIPTTDETWIRFHQKHRICKVQLAIPHDFKDLNKIESVLSRYMPLYHLDVLVCKKCELSVACKKLEASFRELELREPPVMEFPQLHVKWGYCDLK
nr:uncharacterized protein LOC111516137 [Leptinotarsa decemlineata]